MAISTTKPVNTVKNADKPAQVAAKKKSEKEVEEKKTTKKPAAKKSTAKKTDDKKPAGKKKANPSSLILAIKKAADLIHKNYVQ